MPSADVTALETQTGIRNATKTDVQGFYSFPSLPVGHYELEVRSSGFKDYKQTGLILDVNTALLVDVPLQIGEASQEVTVNAAAVQVETTNTHMGEVISDTKMTTVPRCRWGAMATPVLMIVSIWPPPLTLAPP